MREIIAETIDQRDAVAERLGGLEVVRDLTIRALETETSRAHAAESWGARAEHLRRAASIAESLESATEILEGSHALAHSGRTRIGEPLELLPLSERETYCARMLVWTLDSNGEGVREILAHALDVADPLPWHPSRG